MNKGNPDFVNDDELPVVPWYVHPPPPSRNEDEEEEEQEELDISFMSMIYATRNTLDKDIRVVPSLAYYVESIVHNRIIPLVQQVIKQFCLLRITNI